VASCETPRPKQSSILPAYKIAHHGSRNNTAAAMLKRLRCKRFVISTNGDRFRHPDREAIDMLNDVPDSELFFNYRSDTTGPFETEPAWRGRTHYPAENEHLVLRF